MTDLNPTPIDRPVGDAPTGVEGAGAAPSLSGKRILVIEDEYLVATEVAHILSTLGAATTMSASLQDAMEAAAAAADGAVIDIQLRDETAFPVIEKLRAAGVPVILVTGYDISIVPADLAGCPQLSKPFTTVQLQRAALDAFAGAERRVPGKSG